ncbi:MAG: pyruvate synthase subunit beta, partial [Bacillota bacterium]
RQRSSATPYGSWTMTTPKESLKNVPKKDIVGIMAAHRIEYIATLSIAYPEDFIRKVKKSTGIRGTKFFHILAPCPSGWLSKAEDSIKIARMAVKTNIFPLYEIENGEKYIINMKFKESTPVEEYLNLQGRFGYLTPIMIQDIQESVNHNWDTLVEKSNK